MTASEENCWSLNPSHLASKPIYNAISTSSPTVSHLGNLDETKQSAMI